MSILQWVGLLMGLLIVLTRLPMFIWPGPTGERIVALFARRGVLRSWGALLLAVALTITLAAAEPFSLFEWVMLIVAVGMGIAGVISVVSPESALSLVQQVFKEEEFVRFGALVGMAFGTWLIYLSLAA